MKVLARFPSVLWSYSNTLETLTLKNSILLDIPSSVCLKSLRNLHLDDVQFKDQESISNLFRGCPSLEDLLVNRRSNIDVKTFIVAVPSLQRLIIEDYLAGGYLINAPCLKYLKIKAFERLGFCLIQNAPELVEAKIIDVTDITNENILSSLTSAKRLTLHLLPFKIKYPTGIIFYQLVYLELYTLKRWNLLSLMLDSSPKLQTLKLIDPYPYAKKDCPVGWKWSHRKCVPECLLFHLETFMWKRYDWQREDEKEVAIYILKNARRLKKAFISTKPIKSKELEKLEQSREMLNELAAEDRASNLCHLEFEYDTYSYN